MKNDFNYKFTGGIVLLGILVIVMSLAGAFFAIIKEQYSGAGIFMLAASLPVTAAINNVLKKE